MSRAQKNVHFLCLVLLTLEPRETDKSVLKLFSKNLVLKFHFLMLGALSYAGQWKVVFIAVPFSYFLPVMGQRFPA